MDANPTKPRIIPFSASARLEAWEDFPAEEIASGTRKQNGHLWLDDKARGLSAGIWEQGANESRWMDYPVTEFMAVLEGEVVIIEEKRSVTIKAGQSFIIPKGLRCRWTQPGHVKKFFVIFTGPEKADPSAGTIIVDTEAPLSPSEPPPASMLNSPVPTQHTREVYTDPSGQFTVGVWQTTGYERKLIDFTRHELMHLLEGSVTFTDDKGRTQSFKAGDTFFVPLGTPNAWKSEGTLRKIYCIFQPKS